MSHSIEFIEDPGPSVGSGVLGWLLGLRIVRWALRVPLLAKIVIGNAAFVVLAVIVPIELGWSRPGVGQTGLSVVGWTLAVTVVTVLANVVLVNLALSPLRGLESTARRIRRGQFDARARPSHLADGTLAGLESVFNDMLDSLDAGRTAQRALAIEVLEAEERERTRLAHQLYEETAQTLATALVRTKLAAQAGEHGHAALEEIRDDIVTAMEGIKRIARTLRPPELDELGFSQALAAHVRALAAGTSARIECFSDPVDAVLGRESRLALFRVLSDVLGQLVGLDGERTLTVRVTTEAASVVTTISEDTESAAPGDLREGLELDRAEQRAAYFGGVLRMDRQGDRRVMRLTFPASTAKAGPSA